MRKKASKRSHHYEKPIRWLPVDSRLFPQILQFGRVKGVARLFLEVEITMSIFIVVGTLIVAGMKIFTMIVR